MINISTFIKGKYIWNRILFFIVALLFLNFITLILLFTDWLKISIGSGAVIFVFFILTICWGAFFYFLVFKGVVNFNKEIDSYTNGYHSYLKNIEKPFFSKEFESFIDRIQHDIKTEEAIRSSTKQAEFSALQNQINPHFLYNTLEGIRSDALMAGNKHISDIIESLALFFRYTISKIDRMVTLDEELSNLRTYLKIQNYRFGDKILIKEIYDSCDTSINGHLIPKLILQPFIENAITHGFEEKVGQGLVSLIFSQTESSLLITIEDNGMGMTENTLKKINSKLNTVSMGEVDADFPTKGGIAINNVNNRIKLLFGESYGVKLRSILGYGTSVDITLPLQKQGFNSK